MTGLTRKGFFALTGLGLAGCATAPGGAHAPRLPAFRFSLNPATIRGYKCPLKEQVRLAVAAGYTGFEPWLADLRAASPDDFRDARRMCGDGGLKVVNGIGFAPWAVSDPAARAAGLEEMKRDMALLREFGGGLIAAPPFGAHRPGSPKIPLADLAERYRTVLELGDRMGVAADLEFWGHSANLSRLDEALAVAAAADHPKACVLADVFHLHRGGSGFEGLRFLSPATLPVLHMNDWPAAPARESLTDAMRIWPGDGQAPWRRIFGILRAGNLDPWLSIELFNKSYWAAPPLETLKTGLAKMREVVARAD